MYSFEGNSVELFAFSFLLGRQAIVCLQDFFTLLPLGQDSCIGWRLSQEELKQCKLFNKVQHKNEENWKVSMTYCIPTFSLKICQMQIFYCHNSVEYMFFFLNKRSPKKKTYSMMIGFEHGFRPFY